MISLNKAIFESFLPFYEDYLQWGGFPAVTLKSLKKAKEKVLDDIFTSYFQKEIVQFGDFRELNLIRDFILLLAQRVGTRFDVSKIASELGTSRPTIYEYLSFLEGTYFIKTLKPFSRSRDVEIKTAPKVYFCDSGLLNRVAKIDEGRLFENAVFNALKLRGDVNYYQRKTGVELDFILDKKSAFEAKSRATQQELKRVERIASQLGFSEYFVVARNYSPLAKVIYGFQL